MLRLGSGAARESIALKPAWPAAPQGQSSLRGHPRCHTTCKRVPCTLQPEMRCTPCRPPHHPCFSPKDIWIPSCSLVKQPLAPKLWTPPRGQLVEPKRPRSSPSCWSCLRLHSVCSGRAGPRMAPGPPCATGGWWRGRGRVTFPPGLQVEQTRAGEPEDSGREQNSRCPGRGATGPLPREGGLTGPRACHQHSFPVCPPVSK